MVGPSTQRWQHSMACGLLWVVSGIGLAAPEDRPEALGRQCDGFTLSDGRGTIHSLADCDDKQVVVINAQEGTAAKVRVSIESTDGEAVWGTVGVSENVIEASWLALADSFHHFLGNAAR